MGKSKKMTPREFEEAVWEIERVRIYIHLPDDEKLPEYNYQRRTKETDSITAWKRKRLNGLENCGFTIADGDHEVPNGKTNMRSLRASYT